MEIEVQSPYDTKVGAGPIITGRNWRSSPRMNKIGAFSFEMPLNDPRRSYLVQKRYVRCYGMVDGTRTELGKPGIIDSVVKEIDANGIPTGMLRVSGRDLLAELADINIHELSIIDTSARDPDAVEYWDGTASDWLNMANAKDNTAASVEIPADDEDWFYIGDANPFDIVTFDLGTNVNDDSANFKVYYSQGGTDWGTGTILSDTTKVDNASFAQDGSIRWERQEDWAIQDAADVHNIAGMYWLRFRYGEDMSGDVTIIEIDITQDVPTETALAKWLAYEDAASPADTPISDLGWAFETDLDVTDNTVFLILRDVSAFEALTLIAEQTGENFRLGTGRKIEWLRDTKTASGIRATNVFDGIAAEDNEDICLITNLAETEDSYEVVSRVYPQGGGRGSTRVTLLECTRVVPGADYTGYTLSKAANYLLKDSVEAAVPTGYGRRIEMTKFWPGIASPSVASSRDVSSSNALFDLTYEYLSRHWEPQKSYRFSVVKLDKEVKVGQTIQLAYWQTVEGTAVWSLGITAALHLWVLELTHAVDDAGARVVAMQVATIDAWPSSDAGKVKSVVSQIKALQSTDGPMSAASLTVGSVADLMDSLDLSAYYKKPTDTNVILGVDAGNVPPSSAHAIIIGYEAGYSNTSANDNTYVGYRAGRAGDTGYDNTAIGSDAMRLGGGTGNTGLGYRVLENVGATTDGLLNTAVGHQAMRAMDEGDYNVAMGSDAMVSAQASFSVGIGCQALQDDGKTSDGGANTAIGYQAMKVMDTGAFNVAVGEDVMLNFTSGDSNVAVGGEALKSTATGSGSDNVAIGYQALVATTSGSHNIGIGSAAMIGITTGGYNIAIGEEALRYNAAASNNIGIGYRTGYKGSVTTYANCVLIGHEAGYSLESGSANIFIGYQAGYSETGANKLYIENSNSATPLIYGEFDNDLVRIYGDLGLGIAPTHLLHLYELTTPAGGDTLLRVTGVQTDATAMTGTLRGAYIDISNGSQAATGTIRAMELKARTEAPGDTGNDVTVLEGLSISADSKGHSVTTMRAAEFILDGAAGGTITEGVGLRIANNLQADKATVLYGLQIYRDSFEYTADIQLSSGGLIGGSTGDLTIADDGDVTMVGDLTLAGGLNVGTATGAATAEAFLKGTRPTVKIDGGGTGFSRIAEYIGDNLYITQNLRFTGAAWVRDDDALAASMIQLGAGNTLFNNAAAAAGYPAETMRIAPGGFVTIVGGLNVGTTGATAGQIKTSGAWLQNQTTGASAVITQAGAGNFDASLSLVTDDSTLYSAAYDDGYLGVAEYAGKAGIQSGDVLFLSAATAAGVIEFYSGGRAAADKHMILSNVGALWIAGCLTEAGSCEIFTEDALSIIGDIVSHGSGVLNEYGHEKFDMEWGYGKYPSIFVKTIISEREGTLVRYGERTAAKSDLLYRAAIQLDEHRLSADAEREAIRAEFAGLQRRLAVLEPA